jgi:hypothetical protein
MQKILSVLILFVVCWRFLRLLWLVLCLALLRGSKTTAAKAATTTEACRASAASKSTTGRSTESTCCATKSCGGSTGSKSSGGLSSGSTGATAILAVACGHGENRLTFEGKKSGRGRDGSPPPKYGNVNQILVPARK